MYHHASSKPVLYRESLALKQQTNIWSTVINIEIAINTKMTITIEIVINNSFKHFHYLIYL